MPYIGAYPLGTPVANAVTVGSIASGAVTSTAIAANAITTGLIANGAVSAEDIASSAVTADKIYPNAVTSAKLDTGAVTSAKLDTGAVTSDKLDSNLTLAGAVTYLGGAIEKTVVNVSNVVPTITFDPFSQAVVYYAANSNTNTTVTVNFTGLSNLTTGNVLSATVILTNNATFNAYINAVQIDGSAASGAGTGATVLVNGSITGNTLRWFSSSPTNGSANVELYSFNILKAAASSYLVLGSKSNFV